MAFDDDDDDEECFKRDFQQIALFLLFSRKGNAETAVDRFPLCSGTFLN